MILIEQNTLTVSHKTPHLLLSVAWNEFEYFISENLLLYPYPNVFKKKRRGYCYRLPPSVNPSAYLLCYLLLKCVSYSHEWGVQIFAPPPGALGRGQKVKYKISVTKSLSKIFNQTLCVILQIKDIKRIKQDFCS